MPDIEVTCTMDDCRATRTYALIEGQDAATQSADLQARFTAGHPHRTLAHLIRESPSPVRLDRLFQGSPAAAGALSDGARDQILQAVMPGMSAAIRHMQDYLRQQSRPMVDVRSIAQALTPAIPELAQGLQEHWQRQTRQIAPMINTGWISEMIRQFQADNWDDLPLELLSDVDRLMQIAGSGIAVAWVPRAEVLAEIMTADPKDREAVLLARRVEILDDCTEAIAVVDDDLGEIAGLLDQGIEAARAGLDGPAQAMAGNVIETLLREMFPLGAWQGYRKVTEAFSAMAGRRALGAFRQGTAVAPVLPLLTTYSPTKGDPVPGTFNRHATAHAVGDTQYHQLNALIGLMAAASLLRESHKTLLA